MRRTIKLLLALAVPVLAGDMLLTAATTRDPLPVAAQIDKIINQKLAEAKIPASAVCDDGEFIRRAHLDIIGRTPYPDRVAAFLKDTSPNKRALLIDELLADSEYGEHFADIWFHRLIKRDDDNRLLISESFADWLTGRFNKNDGWNKIVSDILTADGGRDKNPAVIYTLAHVGADRQPEPNRLTGSASTNFLGIKLECAECHNHPFSTSKQTDFWGMAAFFEQTHASNTVNKAVKAGDVPAVSEGGKVKLKGKAAKKGDEQAPFGQIVIPDTKGKTVKAKFFNGPEPTVAGKTTLRPTLATWVTAPTNPYFAKAAVNKWWANFFGRGIVNPVDDMKPEAKPSHPQLLDMLAKEFIASDFDLKHLVRCICNSQTYQRTSKPLAENKSDEELYSHAAVRMMTTEQLYDSLEVALNHAPAGKGAAKAKGAGKAGGGGPRAQFRKFFHTEADDDASAVADYAHGIPQALRLMNSSEINNTTAVIASLTKSEGTPEKVIEALYLRTLARTPSAAETKKMAAYVNSSKDAARGYNDVIWALLNSAEFLFNH